MSMQNRKVQKQKKVTISTGNVRDRNVSFGLKETWDKSPISYSDSCYRVSFIPVHCDMQTVQYMAT